MNQEKNKKAKDQVVEMTVVRPNAAGIDVGSTFHVIAVPPGRDEPRVRTFGTTTSDLQKAVDWLKKCAIDSVGMESTGVYWKGIFTALVQNGFEASLVKPLRYAMLVEEKMMKMTPCGYKSCIAAAY